MLNEALKGRVSVIIDERDQDQLDKADEWDIVGRERKVAFAKTVELHKQVRAYIALADQQIRLRTIDNFQGEEAKM